VKSPGNLRPFESVKRINPLLCHALAAALLLIAREVRAADWQWSANVESVTLPGSQSHPRAFLWIPPTCQRVRAIVVGQHNMLEEGILEHPYFRQTLADLGIAEVWVTPGLDYAFRFDQGAGEHFDSMMKALAEVSGYSEIATAPVVPIGHSACASYPWNFAAWNPARTLAVLSVHGDAPLTNRTGSGKPNPDWGARNIDGVPGLMVMGEYEWWQDRLAPALAFRVKNPKAPISFLGDAGHGHFDFSDQLVRYLALFVRKAALYRLPPEEGPLDNPVKLLPVNPQEGWLVDCWRREGGPRAPAAPYAEYKGDPAQAFWCFDREQALATQNYDQQRGKLPQLTGFLQPGQSPEDQSKTLQQVSLKFQPLDDGISFRLKGVFLDHVPPGNPERWTGLPAASPIGHATGGGPIVISRICGPVIQTGPETFSIRFYRMGMDQERSNEIWLVATHPGDDRYKSAVQQANLHFPLRNTQGAEQHITFPAIPDQTNVTDELKLNAISDAGVPVYYYVREGPAEIIGDNILRLTAVPPRSKYPLRVTVVAWQWGRSIEPKLKTAEPVERTFNLVR